MTPAQAAAAAWPVVQVPNVGSIALDAPNGGRLVNGLQLPAQGLYWVTWDGVLGRSPNRADRRWGSDRLIAFLVTVLRDYRIAHPTAPRVLVGDLSRPFGGPFGSDFGGLGHASHQNGLDVDVYYPRADHELRAPAAAARRRSRPRAGSRQPLRGLRRAVRVRRPARGARRPAGDRAGDRPPRRPRPRADRECDPAAEPPGPGNETARREGGPFRGGETLLCDCRRAAHGGRRIHRWSPWQGPALPSLREVSWLTGQSGVREVTQQREGYRCSRGSRTAGHPAGRARPVCVALARGGLGDGGRGAARRRRRRARREARAARRARRRGGRRRAPAVRLARRHEARQRARGVRARPGGPPRARRRRVDGRLHGLPAAGRRRRTSWRSTSPTASWTGGCATTSASR